MRAFLTPGVDPQMENCLGLIMARSQDLDEAEEGQCRRQNEDRRLLEMLARLPSWLGVKQDSREWGWHGIRRAEGKLRC
jgi:hypothetical protein